MIAIRHAWLQKHPSPAATSGEFHWYPREGDRELRASCVERLRGVDPPAVLWELAPGRVVWARPFAAIAPTDARRYVGLVLTIVEQAGVSAADLLDKLVAPPASPWAAPQPPTQRERVASVSLRGFASLDIALEPEEIDDLAIVAGDTDRWSREVDVAGVARALMAGGTARVGDPAHMGLATWIASIERWMPEAVTAKPRRGAWIAGEATRTPDRVAELIAGAWRDRTSSEARAWRVLVDLAEARGSTVDAVAGELDTLDATDALTEEERTMLPPGRAFVDVLHAWGRGQLDRCPTAGTLATRLADAVAMRILAQLVDGSDARAAVAEARWYALLPAARRKTLLETVASRALSLRAFVEVDHA
ncbi:MAG: hypothetical protein ABI867_17085 [Kofleriaceae bacterium]